MICLVIAVRISRRIAPSNKDLSTIYISWGVKVTASDESASSTLLHGLTYIKTKVRWLKLQTTKKNKRSNKMRLKGFFFLGK